jgi:hypothetical protein
VNWRELPLALLLKRVLAPARPARTARQPPRTASQPAAAQPPAAPPRRGPLAIVALAALIAGYGLMIPFEAWFTRLLGVLALFAFVVAGVFAIATPALLERDGDDR